MPRSQSRILLLVSLVITILAGCRTRSAVGYDMILPPGAEQLQVPEGRTFLMASPVSQPLPDVPQGWGKKDSVSVCVEFVIGEDGGVSAITPLYGLAECPSAKEKLDERAVAAAVGSVAEWQFLAAAVCEFPDGIVKNEDCSGDGVVITAMPIKVSYVFAFTGAHARAVVAPRRL